MRWASRSHSPVSSQTNAMDFEEIGRQPITAKQAATCPVTTQGIRAQQPFQHCASTQTKRRGKEEATNEASDKSRYGSYRHGGDGVLRGAPRRRAPPGRPALRPASPAAQQRLPASPPNR
jgi:hypothetical protein